MGARFVNGSSMGARFVNIDEQVAGIDELLTNQYGRIDELLTNWRTIRINWRLDELLPNHWRIDELLTKYWRISEGFVNFTKQSDLTNLSAKWRRFWWNDKLANDMLTSVAYCNNMSVNVLNPLTWRTPRRLDEPMGELLTLPMIMKPCRPFSNSVFEKSAFYFWDGNDEHAGRFERTSEKNWFIFILEAQRLGEWKPLLLALGVDYGVDTCSCFFTFDKWDG